MHGPIGLGIFLMLGLATWRSFTRTIRIAGKHEGLAWAGDLAAMAQVSLVAYFVSGAFLNLAFFDLYYIFVALGVTLYKYVERQVAAEPSIETARVEGSLSSRGDRPVRPAPARLRPGIQATRPQRTSS